MEEAVKEFLKIGSGSGSGDGYGYGSGDGDGYGYGYGSGSGDGYGYGSGDGDGYGYGYGYGSGDGSGDGYGDGSGYGSGSGSGSGYGDGYGDGSGDGSGDGYGYGYGYGDGYGYGYGDGYGDGYGVKTFENKNVYLVDGLQTIFRRIKENIATGYILNSDFTLDKCFIVKDGRFFAHGKTLREAIQSLNEKKWENLDADEVIEEFCKKFKKGESYKGSEFFEWHHYLTGSCLMGRESFVKNHDLNMNDEFTVDEFIRLTEDDYGSEIIKKLKEIWNESEE